MPAAIPDKELRNVAVTSDQALCDWVEAARENGLARLALRALPARPASTPEEADRHALELAAQLMAVASAAGSDD